MSADTRSMYFVDLIMNRWHSGIRGGDIAGVDCVAKAAEAAEWPSRRGSGVRALGAAR